MPEVRAADGPGGRGYEAFQNPPAIRDPVFSVVLAALRGGELSPRETVSWGRNVSV